MKAFDIALKDMIHSFRSLAGFGMMLVVPLMITGLIYMAFGSFSSTGGGISLPDLNVWVLNLDEPQDGQPALGDTLVAFLQDEALPDFLVSTEVPAGTTESEVRQAVLDQKAGAAVIIPANFTASLIADNAPVTLRILQDPALTLGPAILKEMIGHFTSGVSGTKLALTVVREQVEGQGVSFTDPMAQGLISEYAAWYTVLQRNLAHSNRPLLSLKPIRAAETDGAVKANPMAAMLSQIMGGMLVFFTFYGATYTALTIVQEDEEGTLPRLFTTPTQRSTVLGGKMLGVFITVIVQVLVLLAASALAFKINWGQPLAVGMVVVGLVAAASGFGVLLTSFIKTSRQGGPVTGGVLTALGMMGGLFTIGVEMPQAFKNMTLFTPHGWAVRGLQIVQAGGQAGEAFVPMLVLLAMGAAFFALGVFSFRRRYL